jgi:hypothetical protein
MSTDYRAELQLLVKAYDEHGGKWPDHHEQALFQAVEDARAALAQPEPEVPTLDCDEIDVPVWHRGDDFHVYKEGYTAGWAAGAKAAADCYARPAIQPEPVLSPAVDRMLDLQDRIQMGSLTLAEALDEIAGPKPPSLKKRALQLLETYNTSGVMLTADQVDTIRRALEALDD